LLHILEHLFYSLAHRRGIRLPRTSAPPEGFTVIDVQHIPLYSNDQPDRWLMQSVLDYSSSDLARAAAAAWVDAYDAALSLGATSPKAQMLAESALHAISTVTGLPAADWSHA
jgi:hypothetical protein